MSEKELYDSTKKAWEEIWDSASVEVELETTKYRRAIKTRNLYLPYLPKNEPILEAGSGLSAPVISLREMGYEVLGLDYAVNALELSRQYSPDLPLLAGDVHALPFSDNSLAVYLSFGVLEHFEHGMNGALKEAYRVLKPGGIAVITIPYPNIVWRLAQWRRNQAGKARIAEDFYESTYTQHELTKELEAVGFKVEKAYPTTHSFTLWGLSSIFREKGYYKTNWLAEGLGDVFSVIAPWAFNFMTMMIARK